MSGSLHQPESSFAPSAAPSPRAAPQPAPAALLLPARAPSRSLLPQPPTSRAPSGPAAPLAPAQSSSTSAGAGAAPGPYTAPHSVPSLNLSYVASGTQASDRPDDASCGAAGRTTGQATARSPRPGGCTDRDGDGGGALCAAPSFGAECRICLQSEPPEDLVSPCHCTGSMAYAHMSCLRSWVVERRSVHCELCGAMYREPYGSALAAAIPPAPPPQHHAHHLAAGGPRTLTTPDGQSIIIMPVSMGPLLGHAGMGVGGPGAAAFFAAQGAGGPGAGAGGPGAHGGGGEARELEPQRLCEWRNLWSYALIMLLLLFAILYVTVISKRGKQEQWMMTLWQVLLVVLPIYLVLRVAFDLYRHRLAQQLAAANMQAMALANAAVAGGGGNGLAPREVIITRAGNRILVLQRQ